MEIENLLRTKSRSLDDIQIVSNGSTDINNSTQSSILPHHIMLKSAEEAILKYDGRQNLDFTAWKKSFATSVGQKYGGLAQVYRTGEAFECDIPSKPVVSGDEDTDVMESVINRGITLTWRSPEVE